MNRLDHADAGPDDFSRVFRAYRRAARRLDRALQRAVEHDAISPRAAATLARARADLALATSGVFIQLALNSTDRLLDQLRAEEQARTHISPEAVAAAIERGTN